ncbi:hypothetical protein F5887DRAFT_1058967 [Amanita rubescens]|nr:hypothetical protein F5887DRAFT_1058967 [Amanita rubescens]
MASVARTLRHSIRAILHYSTAGHTTLPQPRLDYKSISENVARKTRNALNRKAPLPGGAVSMVAETYTEYKNILNTVNAKRNARSTVGERILKYATSGDRNAKEAAAAITLSIHGPEPISADTRRDHVEICKLFDLMNLESAATVTGSSWYYLMNEAALLETALTNYAISVAIEHGFMPVITPDVVREDIAKRCGFQPRDNSDTLVSQMYHLERHSPGSPNLVLSGTSEIPLAGMLANQIYEAATLPRKIVGLGHAFRAEAGARGADTRGLYRVHQFTKIELFAATTGENSEHMMEELLELQKRILLGLNLPFRVLDMPSEELGASAYRKYDIEAWMPGRGSWGEVSSLSNCTDFQSRRLHVRYRPSRSDIPTELPASAPASLPFIHTLNGTAAAIPRLIVALLENGVFFSKDGTPAGLSLPVALKPFWLSHDHGRNVIRWDS